MILYLLYYNSQNWRPTFIYSLGRSEHETAHLKHRRCSKVSENVRHAFGAQRFNQEIDDKKVFA